MSVLFCSVSYREQGYWRGDFEFSGAYNPMQDNIAPVLMKRMQVNSLFVIKKKLTFFNNLKSYNKKKVEEILCIEREF